jgi:hypothetical protein
MCWLKAVLIIIVIIVTWNVIDRVVTELRLAAPFLRRPGARCIASQCPLCRPGRL